MSPPEPAYATVVRYFLATEGEPPYEYAHENVAPVTVSVNAKQMPRCAMSQPVGLSLVAHSIAFRPSRRGAAGPPERCTCHRADATCAKHRPPTLSRLHAHPATDGAPADDFQHPRHVRGHARLVVQQARERFARTRGAPPSRRRSSINLPRLRPSPRGAAQSNSPPGHPASADRGSRIGPALTLLPDPRRLPRCVLLEPARRLEHERRRFCLFPPEAHRELPERRRRPRRLGLSRGDLRVPVRPLTGHASASASSSLRSIRAKRSPWVPLHRGYALAEIRHVIPQRSHVGADRAQVFEEQVLGFGVHRLSSLFAVYRFSRAGHLQRSIQRATRLRPGRACSGVVDTDVCSVDALRALPPSVSTSEPHVESYEEGASPAGRARPVGRGGVRGVRGELRVGDVVHACGQPRVFEP